MVAIATIKFDQQCCGNCLYWRQLKGKVEYVCMRFPPQVIGYLSINANPTKYLQQAFPETEENIWCGEWTRVKRKI